MTKKQKAEVAKFVANNKIEARTGPGKPATLTWEMLTTIKALLYEGQFQKYVFQTLGIPKPTWDSWRKRGEKVLKAIQEKEKKYKDLKPIEEKEMYLAYIIYTGKTKAIQKHQRIIMDAGKKDWRASKWYLEITDREQFGQKVEAEIKGEITMSSIVEKFKERTGAG
jgi:hypothetical protein